MTRTIVVSLGRSGLGAARLLKQQNRDVVVFERGDNEALQNTSKTLAEEGIQVVLGQPLTLESFAAWRDNLDAVVIGPGIPGITQPWSNCEPRASRCAARWI